MPANTATPPRLEPATLPLLDEEQVYSPRLICRPSMLTLLNTAVEAVDVLMACHTLVGGNLREFELEGQRTRQRYFCMHHT